MYNHFFSHVAVNPENIDILNGNAEDLEAECIAYEEKIKRAGGIELFLGGIGPDGHFAFNEPGLSLRGRIRVKTLAYDTIIANSRYFGDDLNKVPKMALTVGVQTVMDAREVVIITTGVRKALALQKCFEGGINHMWTLSSLQMHPHAIIVVDEDATLKLQVKTVKAFRPEEFVLKKRDSILQELDSPKSPSSKNSLAAPRPDLTRQVTPEPVPDCMHERVDSPEKTMPGFDGLEAKELPLSSMHQRVDSARA